MSDAAEPAVSPGRGHNNPPSEAQKLLADASKALRAASRHDKKARQQLQDFLVHVMEICEYARQSATNASDVRDELDKAGVLHLKKEGDWLRPLVTAAFPKDERENERSNVSKYVSVLSHAEREGKATGNVPSVLLKQWFEAGASIAKLAAEEAKARRKEKQEASSAGTETSEAATPKTNGTPQSAEVPPPTFAELASLWNRADPETQTLFRQHIGCDVEFPVTAPESGAEKAA